MRFRILGPLEVQTGQDWTAIGASKWRAVLACLLLNAGQIVSTDTLIDELWGNDPPAKAANLISIYVLRLRRLIGDTEGQVLVTRAPGYQLRLDGGDLDAEQFGTLMSQGRQALAAGDPERAAMLLTDSLSLWRGRALADIPLSAFVAAEAGRLEELRLAATELRIEADLACGRHRLVIPELRRLLADQQLKEELWLLLMRALEGAGRRAEALSAYEQARNVIADQLGVDPGREMQQLFQQLLSADVGPAQPAEKKRTPATGESGSHVPSTERDDADPLLPSGSGTAGEEEHGPGPVAESGKPGFSGPPGSISLGAVDTSRIADPSPPSPAPRSAEPGPMQLPADITDFTGRDYHVKQLCDLLSADRSDDNPGAVPVALVAGAGGLGKTALAVHAAHRMRSAYPDGQLYVDLLGSSLQPLASADVLARFLRDLGVKGAQIPVSQEERGALYRTRLNGRRMLIVLDNARDAAQVRPLLPGSAACAVIVTSRSRLPDLVGGRLVHLDVLNDSEALTLFSRIVGAERAAAEADATAELLLACAGLPLAIRICAARLAARSGWTIRSLADRIGDEHRRLDELKVGDLAVRASFEVSFASLPAEVVPGGIAPAHVFRMLGLWQGPSIGLSAAAALLGEPEERVVDALEFLVDAHLLESPAPDRYAFHDLLRVYAADRAAAEEPEHDRTDALRRLLSWYVHTADAAAQIVSPYRYRGELDEPKPGCRPLHFVTIDQALSWYDAERASLVAATGQAAELRFDDVAWQLPVSLFSMFNRVGNWADCVVTHRIAMVSSRRTGNRCGESWVLNNLGAALGPRHMNEAVGYLEEALAIRREIGDRQGEAQTANNLADVYLQLGRPREALGPLQRSLLIQRERGHRRGEGIALHNLGEAYLELDRFDEAIESLKKAHAIFAEMGVLHGEGWVLHSLGRAYLGLDRTDDALRCLREALAIRQSAGDRRNQAFTLRLLGQVSQALGDVDSAHDCWNQALAIFSELGDDVESAEITEVLTQS
jgi:DNA-binding SARP family transcriptional activator